MMPTKILPNQSRAFHTPAQAWVWALNIIEQFGDKIRTEDNQLCKEVMNLQVTVLEPCNPENWPIHGSNWDMAGLDKYAEQLMSPENPGFDYTYGERLRGYPISRWCLHIRHFDSDKDLSQDQIQDVISKLRANPNTRRAISITWVPEVDNNKRHVPCLQSVDFLYRAGKLHLIAYFRSWDVKQAAPANMYGLARLLSYVAEKVGVPAGSLTVFAASGHVYEV